MRPKALVSSTIIPPHLYVFREADRQLERILLEMGRPGYVLVARQMGKTNLLLNAKRRFENRDNPFVYVDLSKPFDTERDCFRTIVDTALDTKSNEFAKVRDQISAERKLDLPPFREHENELRHLLSQITGKLVIILDEIDSLTHAPFSNKIFAQIRSVYFSRPNVPAFDRLTYILSGVVEPNEIIKDKKISPFNIGEKIYLDDFSYPEFLTFLKNATLDFSASVIQRINYWTNGNPRMTWDLCSELENNANDNWSQLSEVDVDAAVKKLYLRDFNQPPVDHIRQLIAEDDELRDAITVLKFNKGDSLPDKVKSKLYLAGIIRFGDQIREVKIKNRVLEEALSDQWLQAISIKKKGALTLANEAYENGDYADALKYYELHLETSEFPKLSRSAFYYNLGSSAYQTKAFEKALKYLKKAEIDEDDSPKDYWSKTLLVGLCHYKLKQYKECIENYSAIVKAERKDITYFKALLSLASTYFIQDRSANASVAGDYYRKVFEHVNSNKITREEADWVCKTSHFNLGAVQKEIKNFSAAREEYYKALELALPEEKPRIYRFLINVVDDQSQQIKILEALVNVILTIERKPKPENVEGLEFNDDDILFLLYECSVSMPESYPKCLDYILSKNLLQSTSKQKLLNDLAFYAVQQQNLRLAEKFWKEVLAEPGEDQAWHIVASGWLSLFVDEKEAVGYRNTYCSYLKARQPLGTLQHLDFRVVIEQLGSLLQHRKFKEGEDLIAVIKSFSGDLSPELKSGYATILCHEMIVCRKLGFFDKAYRKSKELLEYIRDLKPVPDEVISWETICEIRSLASEQLESLSQMDQETSQSRPFVRSCKYKANEWIAVKYKDGRTARDKFKRLKPDLEKELCEVVSRG